MTDTTTPTQLPAPVKPGWQTTEFWLSVAAKLLGILYASGAIGDGTVAARIAGLATTVLAALGYTVARAAVKVAAQRADSGTANSSPTTSRAPQAGRARLTVLILLALGAGVALPAIAALNGCATIKADAKKAEVAAIDCTKADAVAIGAVVAELGTQATVAALGRGSIDWSAIESASWAQGKVIGGCALAEFVAALGKEPAPQPSVASLVEPPDPAADGRAALERFRARAGGARWSTSAGVL